MKYKGKLIIGGVLLLAFGLIVIGGNENRQLQSVSTLGNKYSAAASTAVSGKRAPDFSLQSLDGSTITLSDYRGEKAVILDFWASWCPNCRRDMPKLSGWYEQYKDRVEVIGINLQEREGVAAKFIDSSGIKFPIVLDPRAEVARAYGIQYTNYHVLIRKDGTIAGIVPGDINESQILSLIESS